MFSWYDAWKEMEIDYDERLAWSEKERLIEQVLNHHSSTTKAHQRWLAQLGAALVSWGCRLQARYDRPIVISGTLRQEQQAIKGHIGGCAS
jgi:hypothetical protein